MGFLTGGVRDLLKRIYSHPPRPPLARSHAYIHTSSNKPKNRLSQQSGGKSSSTPLPLSPSLHRPPSPVPLPFHRPPSPFPFPLPPFPLQPPGLSTNDKPNRTPPTSSMVTVEAVPKRIGDTRRAAPAALPPSVPWRHRGRSTGVYRAVVEGGGGCHFGGWWLGGSFLMGIGGMG